MYNSEDLERFYFQYQTEAVPRGVSIQPFCLQNNVPYNLFHKWYKDVAKYRLDCMPIVKKLSNLMETFYKAPVLVPYKKDML